MHARDAHTGRPCSKPVSITVLCRRHQQAFNPFPHVQLSRGQYAWARYDAYHDDNQTPSYQVPGMSFDRIGNLGKSSTMKARLQEEVRLVDIAQGTRVRYTEMGVFSAVVGNQ